MVKFFKGYLSVRYQKVLQQILVFVLVGIVPILIAMTVLDLWNWDLSVPLVYSGSDDVWQLVLTKMLKDTGWIFGTPFLGAPASANWQHSAAAQTSALHSIIMLALSNFINDSVKLQQVYYIINFSLISLSAYIACRLIKITKFAAVSIAILFSFTSFRIGWMFYSFLTNYFAVPLSLVPIYWILTGELSCNYSTDKYIHLRIFCILRSKKFWISFVCILLITLSDGYYAFFTLLLLGFTLVMRAFSGDIKKPISLFPNVFFIISIISFSFMMSLPLSIYKSTHPDEFYLNGKIDPVLMKHPFEAEVYSSSLKLLMTPIPEHHIRQLGEIGQRIIKTSDAARKFPIGKPIVSLGTIGSVLFFGSLILLAKSALYQVAPSNSGFKLSIFLKNNPLLWASVLLSTFIFLCSISGGIGTIVALFYPTIRAYDRFPLYLIFCLFVGAGSIATVLKRKLKNFKIGIAIFITLLLTIIGLYDQIPYNAAKGSDIISNKFLAERKFIHHIESIMPIGTMIYQYPHSQYLRQNKYYGWGSFAHIRLYLHSTGLHWSNGASKNSPVENWHEEISSLPLDNLIEELEAVGFRGFIIDRTVVPANEYQQMRKTFSDIGLNVIDDAASRLSFAKLKDPGFQIIYDNRFREVQKLVIFDKKMISNSRLSSLINKKKLHKLLSNKEFSSLTFPITIEKKKNSEIFYNVQYLTRGAGVKSIQPLSDMKGQLLCSIDSHSAVASQKNTVLLTLKNDSDFDWYLGKGKLPLRIGTHIRKLDGTLIRWDDGLRVPADFQVKQDSSVEIHFPLINLDLKKGIEENSTVMVEFELVQDGNAWFSSISCSFPVQNF